MASAPTGLSSQSLYTTPADSTGHSTLPPAVVTEESSVALAFQPRSVSQTAEALHSVAASIVNSPAAKPTTEELKFTVKAFEINNEKEGYAKYPEIQDLLNYLENSPTAWQAAHNAAARLKANGYVELNEVSKWKLKTGGKYFILRNDSSLIAFVMPTGTPASATILGAHTDSPGLKLKPNPDQKVENYRLLSTQIYGGPTLPSWFNRPLGIAGRCFYEDSNGKVQQLLVDIRKPIATIAQLAIHLNRDLGLKLDINAQKEMNAIVGYDIDIGGNVSYIDHLIQEHYHVKPLPGADLFLVPLEKPFLMGLNSNMISSPRLDNLLGCHASVDALLKASEPSTQGVVKMIALWDNEEVGSSTAHGAASPFLKDTLNRLTSSLELNFEDHLIFLKKSYLVSNDVAHALHPNHPEKHEPNHKILFGRGVVIKINAQFRYATDAESEAAFVHLLVKNGIAYNQFAVRSDSTCGSTIGPICSTDIGIKTIDIGEPVLSMHSIVELGSCQDHLTICKALEELLKSTN